MGGEAQAIGWLFGKPMPRQHVIGAFEYFYRPGNIQHLRPGKRQHDHGTGFLYAVVVLHGGKLGFADHGGNDKYSTFSAKAGSGNRQMMSGILGVLLAGGRSSRMGGGDKCLAMLHGQTLLTRAIARARPQVSELILNANGDAARFLPFGLTIVPDVIEGQAGPLAGILSARMGAGAPPQLHPCRKFRHRHAVFPI